MGLENEKQVEDWCSGNGACLDVDFPKKPQKKNTEQTAFKEKLNDTSKVEEKSKDGFHKEKLSVSENDKDLPSKETEETKLEKKIRLPKKEEVDTSSKAK